MATKLVTFQQAAASKKSEKIWPVTSCRERASNIWPSHQRTDTQDDQRTSHTSYKSEQTGNPQLVKKKTKQINQWAARELPGLGFCYVTPSIRHILRKAKVFCKELCCDRYNNTTTVAVLNEPATTVDAYFSIPVIPPPTLP